MYMIKSTDYPSSILAALTVLVTAAAPQLASAESASGADDEAQSAQARAH